MQVGDDQQFYWNPFDHLIIMIMKAPYQTAESEYDGIASYVAHCCTIFLGHLGIDIEIQISISERSSGWAIN